MILRCGAQLATTSVLFCITKPVNHLHFKQLAKTMNLALYVLFWQQFHKYILFLIFYFVQKKLCPLIYFLNSL